MALNTRQRILLYFLNCNQSSTGRTVLMKWLFLYSKTNVSQVSSYNFVPYKYGPFSFEAYQDLTYALSRFIQTNDTFDCTDQTIRLRPDIKQELRTHIAKISSNEREYAAMVWTTYHRMTRVELLEYVYQQYPWYASRSELVEPSTIPIANIQVYTSGYEGKSIDAFFDCLLKNGIKGILDVRRNAYSQKFGFSEGILRRTCDKLDIKYNHIPDLGIASELRQDLQSPGTLDRLFNNYELELEHKNEALQAATQIIILRPTVLLCFEAEPHQCHRGRLAPKLAHLSNLDVKHL